MTFIVATVGWVFFRADNIGQAGQFIGAMFGMGDSAVSALEFGRLRFDRLTWIIFAAAAVLCFFFKPSQEALGKSRLAPILVPLFFLLAVGDMFFQAYRPFLYFQF